MLDTWEEDTTCFSLREIDANGRVIDLHNFGPDEAAAVMAYHRSDAHKKCLFRMDCSVKRLMTNAE